MEGGRLDSVSIAGIAVFSALAILLSAVSQALGLNFPVIPYLQFDLGEIAIVTSFFIFGPVPACVASFVEFLGLEAYGLNRPLGPALKLIALLSTVAGLWLGARLAGSLPKVSVRTMVASSTVLGVVSRVLAMTAANYYLVVYIYGVSATVSGYSLTQTFSLVGLSLAGSDTMVLILAFTAVFNALQLLFVIALSYTVLRFPPVSNLKVAGRAPWFVSVTSGRTKPKEAP